MMMTASGEPASTSLLSGDLVAAPAAPDADTLLEAETIPGTAMRRRAGEATGELPPLPPLPRPPLVGTTASQTLALDPQAVLEWQNVIQGYEAEIAALAETDPRRALLHYEIGRIWDDVLGNPRNAGAAYQKAHEQVPDHVPNIRAARRLFTRAALRDPRRWEMVVRLIDAEIAVYSEPRHRAALLIEKCEVLGERQGRRREARQALEEALALDPRNLNTLKRLERALVDAADWQALFDAYERALSGGPWGDADHVVRAELEAAQGRVAEEHLGDPSAALDLYGRAHAADPRNEVVAQALRRLLARFHKWRELADLYEGEAHALRGEAPAAAVLPLYLASRVCVEHLGDETHAVALLGEATALAPNDALVLEELRSLHERRGDFEQLAAVYTRQVQLTSDERELTTLFYKLGELYAERLLDDDEATRHFQRVVELDPHYVPAQQALGALYHRSGRWEELAEMYRVEARDTTDAEMRIGKLFKRAEIYDHHLGSAGEAIVGYEAILEVRPDYTPALKALGRLYRTDGRFADLVTMHERELAVCRDEAHAVSLLGRIAALREERLDDLPGAIVAWRRIRELRPHDTGVIATLGRLYDKAGAWADLVAINEAEIAGCGDDARRAVVLLARNGELYEERLGDKDAAVASYRRALELSPSYLPALKGLGRLYHQRGAWRDLVDMYRRELEVATSDALRVTLLYKIGQTCETRLIEEDEAVGWYRRALEVVPDHGPTIKSLLRLYEARREWEALGELYRAEFARVQDVEQKVSLAWRVADLYETRLGRADLAVDTYRQALDLRPDYLPTLRALMRLYESQERWSELLDTCERVIAAAARAGEGGARHEIDVRLRMAEISGERLHDTAREVACHEAVVGLDPGHVPALRALARLYRARGEHDKLLTTCRRLAERTNVPEEKVHLRLEMAALKEMHQGWDDGGDGGGGVADPALDAADDYLEVLAHDPVHPRALSAMDDIYRRRGDWRGLVALLGRRRLIADVPRRRLELSMAIADIDERRLEDLPAAIAAYEEALAIDPGYLPAVRSLKRIYQKTGHWEKLTELLEMEGRVTVDAAQALAALYQAGTLREGFGADDAAVADFERVLEIDSSHGPAFKRLEVVLARRQRWRDLVTAHERRLRAAPGPQARAETLLAIGGLYERRLGDVDAAMRAYQSALGERPDHVATLTALAGAYFERRQWDEALATYHRVIELTAGHLHVRPETLVPVHGRLGQIYAEHRPDARRALMHLEAVVRIDPQEATALELLARLYREAQDWPRAAEVLGRLVAREEGSAEVDATRRLALQRTRADVATRAGDVDALVEAHEAVLAFDPTDEVASDALLAAYRRTARWPRLLDLLAARVRRVGLADPRATAPLHLERGRIYEVELGDVERATGAYREALAVAPEDIAARQALARLYGREEAGFDEAIAEHRRIVAVDPYAVESHRELYRIFKAQQRFDAAWCVADLLVHLGAAGEAVEPFWRTLAGKAPHAPTGPLTPEQNAELVVHPEDAGFLHDLYRAIGEDLCAVYAGSLDEHGLGRGDRLASRSEAPARRLVDAVAGPLGLAPARYDVYVTRRETDLLALDSAHGNAAVLIGADLVAHPSPELNARLAALMQRALAGLAVLPSLGRDGVERVAWAVVRACDADFSPPEVVLRRFAASDLDETGRRVLKALGRKARRAAEEVVLRHVEDGPAVDADGWLARVRLSCDRAALVVTGDLPAALRHAAGRAGAEAPVPWRDLAAVTAALGDSLPVRELVTFAVSDAWFTARARLGLAIV